MRIIVTLLLGLLFLPVVTFSQSREILGFSPKRAVAQRELENTLLSIPQPATFRNHLRELTRYPHRAGSPASQRVVQYLQDQMRDAGLEVATYDYEVYIPAEPGTNRVEIVSPIRLPLNNQEYILPEDPFSADTAVSRGWNAFSGSGKLTAEVVYANYGTREDFDRLRELGIDVAGKIVIARYGRNFRGYKAKYAEEAGAGGLIIYSDPADNGYAKGLTYPDGPFASESTIQRGSLLTLDYTGDPLTPFEPALPGEATARLAPESVEGLHQIPVLPLPYGSAREMLGRMEGGQVPTGWQGGLPFTYRLEGGPNLRVEMEVAQKLELVRISNVVGKIVGTEFPDEWIILGCHHDAWEFGAVDPNSGTATLLTLAEALGELAQAGRRPRRSILIAHWDAEEYGIIGSTEWVEQFKEELKANAVAYLNADGAVSGPTFYGSASPSLKQPLLDACKAVPYPGTGQSVYEHWLARAAAGAFEPSVGNLGGGSDHVGFYTHVGVPSLGAGFMGSNGIYHSAYDNFAWYEKFGDTAFVYGPTLANVYGVLSLRFANADFLPYDVPRYARDLKTHFQASSKEIRSYYPTYSEYSLLHAADRLTTLADQFAQARESALSNNRLKAGKRAEINQKLIALEKSFIDTEGMHFGPWYQSLYAAPDPYSGYAAWMLPGLKYEASRAAVEKLPDWEARYLNAVRNLSRKIEMLLLDLKK